MPICIKAYKKGRIKKDDTSMVVREEARSLFPFVNFKKYTLMFDVATAIRQPMEMTNKKLLKRYKRRHKTTSIKAAKNNLPCCIYTPKNLLYQSFAYR